MISIILFLIVGIGLTIEFLAITIVVYSDYKDMSKYEKSLLRTKITVAAFSIMIVLFGFTATIMSLNFLSEGTI